MNYSENITAKHSAWTKAENAIPENEWEKGYKTRSAKARKLWREFAEACEAENLKPVEVAHDFTASFREFVQSNYKKSS